MKIILLGSSGMLGHDCKEILSKNHEIIAPSRNEMDITRWDEVIETLQTILPDVVVNCAAFTDVDTCETEEFLVRKSNVEGPRNLAQGCARFGCKLVHISSDYIFDGQKMLPQPYFEDDSPAPLSAYGKSKMESEVAVRDNSPNYIIVRTSWLYGMNGDNYVKSIIRRAVQKDVKSLIAANDQFGSPTWTYRVSKQIAELLKIDGRGTYHATAEGHCTRQECTQAVLKKLKIKKKVEACSLRDFETRANRPMNCILENRMLKQQGINIMPAWREDLNAFLSEFGKKIVAEAKAAIS
ncbi:MAG: dTDP-4-dehydrorhamnose reductase [Deltaproteobacteria bacterium]|nr:dTDP-4-dehydrorhamnose reductase [Deltaproteobacteria bacterium]